MTIAAAYHFNQGVLLCADTEFTEVDLKTRGSKIFVFDFASNGGSKAVFSFSGPVAYAKMAIEQIARALQRSKPSQMLRSGMQEIIARELHAFHQKHVYKHPYFRYQDGPNFDLLFLLWSPQEGLGLYHSSEEAIEEITGIEKFVFAGKGATLARYLSASMVRHEHLRPLDIAAVASYVLAEVKTWVPGCGGGSELLVAGKDGAFSPVAWFDISHVNQVTEIFNRTISYLFLDACDLEHDYWRDRLSQLTMEIDALREYLKRENRENRGLRQLLDAFMAQRVRKL